MSARTEDVPAIQVLPPHVVERIAAGEVVERPVSVVRELLDNALDAGSHEIRISIRGGGLRSIRVSDDGVGVQASQVDLALRHHATSKIRDVADLIRTSTLGFRGEALPSIAAVSEMTVLTAVGEAAAVLLELRYGEQVARRYSSRPHGTTITVRNLFANTPARLKFVSSARSESTQINQLVRRYALAHPTVRFQLVLEGRASFHTSGLGLAQTLAEVWGSTVAAAMVPLQPERVGDAEWTGYLTGSHVTRASRHHVNFVINGRCVHSSALLHACEEGYRRLLPRGRHPVAWLALQVPRHQVDINVHPSKAEVKIEDEQAIGTALRDAVSALLGHSIRPPIHAVNFAVGVKQAALPRMVAETGPEWNTAAGERLGGMMVTGQVHGSLIVAEDARGVLLVDQHRAHERAIYELLVRRHGEGRAGQLLLEPLHIELSTRQIERLEPRLPELAALGFTCEWFGGRSFLVRSVPAIPETNDLALVVEDLLDMVTDDGSDWQHRLLTSIACRSATRRGKQLSRSQCGELVNLLAATTSPALCPHGSPVILEFSDGFLRRQFHW